MIMKKIIEPQFFLKLLGYGQAKRLQLGEQTPSGLVVLSFFMDTETLIRIARALREVMNPHILFDSTPAPALREDLLNQFQSCIGFVFFFWGVTLSFLDFPIFAGLLA